MSPLLSFPRASGRFRSRDSFAAAAALAAVAAPSLAQAQIVWSGTLNTTVNSGSTQTLLDFNLNSTPDAEEAYLTFTPFNPSVIPPDAALVVVGITSSKADPSIAFLYADDPLSFGATIDSSVSYVEAHASLPADGNSYYYAFNYQTAGGSHYGWMQISFASDGESGTLHQWAYNSVAGASLTAGQTSAIPEPATVSALLGAAALGAVAWWRRRPTAARA
jgi:hypothetical protein